MLIYDVIIIAALIGFAIATVSFVWPDRVLMRSAVAAIFAWVLPYLAAFIIGPFLGEGAGLGVALILYVLSAAILFAAISASLGAAVRYIVKAIRR